MPNYQLLWLVHSLFSPQRHRDRPELEVGEAAPCAAAAQDGKPRACAEGCVRLCCHLAQECVEYPHRLHALPPHFRHGRRPALQRQVLLLQRPLQAHPRRMPVSSIIIASRAMVVQSAKPHQLSRSFIKRIAEAKSNQVLTPTSYCRWRAVFRGATGYFTKLDMHLAPQEAR